MQRVRTVGAVLSTLIVLVLALAGCGGGSDDSTSSDSTVADGGGDTTSAVDSQPTPAERGAQPAPCDVSPSAEEVAEWSVPAAADAYEITLMQVQSDTYYQQALKYGADDAAGQSGINLTTVTGTGYVSPQVQLTQARTAIEQGTEAIVLAPSDLKGSVPVVDLANANDIPVVSISTEVDSNDVYSVQQDDFTIGKELAKEVAATVGEDAGPGIYVVGPENATFAINREAGFKEEIQNYPGLEVVEYIHPQEVDPALGVKEVRNAFQAHPDIAWIAGNGYILAPPSGFPDDLRGQVPYITMQYEPDIIPLLESGELTSVLSVAPIAMGRIGVSRAVEILNGEEPPKYTCIPSPRFTEDEVGTPLADAELIPEGRNPEGE